MRRLLDVQVRVDRDGAVLATTSPTLENVRLPVRGRADVSAGGTDYRRVSRFTAREPDDEVTIVSLFAVIEERSTLALVAVVGVVIGFLVLAFVFAVIVSRTLSSEVQRLLHAAQRLGRGISPSPSRPRATTSSPRSARRSPRSRASSRRG